MDLGIEGKVAPSRMTVMNSPQREHLKRIPFPVTLSSATRKSLLQLPHRISIRHALLAGPRERPWHARTGPFPMKPGAMPLIVIYSKRKYYPGGRFSSGPLPPPSGFRPPEIRYSSAAHFPRSMSLQRSEQNGLKGLSLQAVSFLQIGQGIVLSFMIDPPHHRNT